MDSTHFYQKIQNITSFNPVKNIKEWKKENNDELIRCIWKNKR